MDAFAGCGGLSLGLLTAGWRGLFAIEKDDFAFDTLRANLVDGGRRLRYDWPSWLEKKPWTIEELINQHRERLSGLRGRVDLLAGGPPCQGFSSAGRRKPSDPRNELFKRYLEFVELVQPRIVLIENVKGFTYDFVEKGKPEERRNFAAELVEKLGENYHVRHDTLALSEYGVPQQRQRFFIVGMLRSEFDAPDGPLNPFTQLKARKKAFLAERGLKEIVSSQQAISDLQVEVAGKKPCPDSKGFFATKTAPPRTAYQRLMRKGHRGDVGDTRLAKHRDDIATRFATIIQDCKDRKRLNVQLNQEMRDHYGIKKMATRVLDPSKPSPTITSMPDDLLHYAEPRTLTVRENARLQTFPDWFCFKGKYTTGGERRAREVPRFTQVANAVPPLIAEMMGLVLFEMARARRRQRRPWRNAKLARPAARPIRLRSARKAFRGGRLRMACAAE
ncbi:MAG TPA: DNA cytosine methyltransferase [Caulobacter sp.]|nr:DNA cytosine methyltransferase [Caulobacter sp.]